MVDGGWEPAEQGSLAGKRRRRPKRRMPGRRPGARLAGLVAFVAVIGLTGAGYYWLSRPAGLAALPDPAVVAPGGFRAAIGEHNTITVGLEIRNIADTSVTIVDARITPPPGLTSLAVSVIQPGPENEGLALTGDLPQLRPVELGTDPAARNAVVAARFQVDCARLPAPEAVIEEQIFVTIQVGREEREEELTPPVVGDVAWLTATAHRVCTDPLPTGSPEPPEPPLPPDPSPTAG